MERASVVWGRGVLCALTLAGLAACNSDGSNSSADTLPAANSPQQPAVPNPNQPQPTNPDPGPTPAPPSNVAPEIQGTPGSEVRVGASYSFVPTVTDADSDTLSFSIQSKPSWAKFDKGNGRLSGTPKAEDVGSYEEIVIRVTDGKTTRALPEFSINVVQQSNGSVTLAWEAPTQNTDGSALTNLEGYRIHYGTESGNYDQTIDVDSAGITRYVVDNLSPGTYFFAISAVSANGAESELSGEASKTI